MSEEIKKAIEITELQKDRAQLIAQMQAVQGAIQYIDNKIAGLTAKDKTDERQAVAEKLPETD